jgi:(E)-4-hydroxy-3-methylbut-2-enyl-diphosphate synthase
MQLYCESLTDYRRLKTREVNVGSLALGNYHPIRVQTMTTTDTMNTRATVEQTIRCIEAGAELVRITAPSKKEAENLLNIKNELHSRGYFTPLVADIHFTPNAAEIAARIIEKVRVNPGNYVDKKKFEQIDYTDLEYLEEIDRIRERFTPLVKICREYGTAMRIGTNHGSLSDRIMSRYGDTAIGMVESAMEFLRIARGESYHNIVLSMKSSNPQVMVQAYRLLIHQMDAEFGECYPLHLGVTEAGDGEDGRVKSAAGIGTLLEDGIGDTIRVSLTEDPELEIPVCKDLVKRYETQAPTYPPPTGEGNGEDKSKNTQPVPQLTSKNHGFAPPLLGEVGWGPHGSQVSPVGGDLERASGGPLVALPYSPFSYKRRETFETSNIGGKQVPVVIADVSKLPSIAPQDLVAIGYTYNEITDKWNISDGAADYIFTGKAELDFSLPGTLKVLTWPNYWLAASDKTKYFPIFDAVAYTKDAAKSEVLNFVMLDCFSDNTPINDFTGLDEIANDPTVVLCLSSKNQQAVMAVRRMFIELMNRGIKNPAVLITDSYWQTPDEHLIHFATETGALLLDGFGDGICLGMTGKAYRTAESSEQLAEDTEFTTANKDGEPEGMVEVEELVAEGEMERAPLGAPTSSAIALQPAANTSGRNYTVNHSVEQFLNTTAFSILQATRTRISKTEYISCPSCGRTLFDLQETTAKIRSVTNHLKGVKIAIMGCIVNGPGEMADADFGYVGSGPGRITLYKGKEVVKRNVSDEVAVEELIQLLKENEAWIEPVK